MGTSNKRPLGVCRPFWQCFPDEKLIEESETTWTVAFLVRIQRNRIAAAEPDRCVLIEADAGPDIVAARIWAALRHRFANRAAANTANSA